MRSVTLTGKLTTARPLVLSTRSFATSLTCSSLSTYVELTRVPSQIMATGSTAAARSTSRRVSSPLKPWNRKLPASTRCLSSLVLT